MLQAAARTQTALFFVYCSDCSNCVAFVAMKDAESPRTLFEAIYVDWPTPPQNVREQLSCNDICAQSQARVVQDCAMGH